MSEEKDQLKMLERATKEYPNFPKPGILFRDIFSILQNPNLFKMLMYLVLRRVNCLKNPVPNVIAAIEARGFLFGPRMAQELQAKFIPIRKSGKLPGKVVSVTYQLEYGEDTLEMQAEYIEKGDNVLLVDDLLATGGTAAAALNLISGIGANVNYALFIYELLELNGRCKLPQETQVISMISI